MMMRIVLDTNGLDKHFKPLQQITYPRLAVLKLTEFVEILKKL